MVRIVIHCQRGELRMKAIALYFMLIVTALTLSACGSSGGALRDEKNPSGANITREQAVSKIEAVSAGAGGADVSSSEDMDKVSDGVRYYFIKAVFPNRMAAEYYIDEKEGNVFVAIGGELDTSNPLPSQAVSPIGAEAEKVTEITAVKSSAAEDIFEVIGMTAQQLEQKFGSGYSKVSVDYNGYMDGFLYSDEGFTAAFGDDGKVKCIYCGDKIDIGGAKSGMDFSQIQEKLGKTAFRQTWVETPVNAAFEIEYSISGAAVVFFSRQSDGSNSIMCIR